jgi:choline transport protein
MHMSEEMHNPKLGVPRAMIGCVVLNALMGFAMLIAILFGMGELDAALSTSTGFPIIEIFYWMSRENTAATTALCCTIIFSASMATLGLQASASRILWAAARDNVMPGSRWLSKLSTKQDFPICALVCTGIILAVIELLNIASTVAFTAILSLAVVALYISYLMPVTCMLYRRLQTPQDLKYGPWRLPNWLGITANAVSICYTIFASIFLLLPPSLPLHRYNMNYACAVLGGVLTLSGIFYLVRGRKHYTITASAR